MSRVGTSFYCLHHSTFFLRYRHKQKRHPQLIKCRTSSSSTTSSSLIADADPTRSPALNRSVPSQRNHHHSASGASSSNSGSGSSSDSSSARQSLSSHSAATAIGASHQQQQSEMSSDALSHKARLAEKEKARRLIQKLKRQVRQLIHALNCDLGAVDFLRESIPSRLQEYHDLRWCTQ